MKKRICPLPVLILFLALIFSCSKKAEEVKPVENAAAEPQSIAIDTMKLDLLIADTCEVDTFIFDESMIDSFSIDTSNVIPSDNGNSLPDDLKVLGLKGSVKSVSEISYKAEDKFGEIQKGQKTGKSSMIFFEMSGMVREEQYFGSDGKILNSKRNIYDNSGNKIENSFDKDGKPDSSKKITYDNNGCVIDESVYNSLGRLESKYRYKYIGMKMTEACEYNSDGKPSRVELFAYDRDGNKTEENFYDSEGELTDSHRITYETDNEGNKIVKDVFKTEGIENVSWEKFDLKGNKIEQGSGKTGDSNFSVTEFRFDENGNIIEESCNNPEQLIKYTYEYDKAGNWITRISYEKKVGIPQVLTERTIVYYE